MWVSNCPASYSAMSRIESILFPVFVLLNVLSLTWNENEKDQICIIRNRSHEDYTRSVQQGTGCCNFDNVKRQANVQQLTNTAFRSEPRIQQMGVGSVLIVSLSTLLIPGEIWVYLIETQKRQLRGKETSGGPRRRWKDNIKMDLQEVGRGCGDWMELAQDRDGWRALVSTVMNFRVP